MDLGTIQDALNRAAKVRAQSISDELKTEGHIQDHVSVKDKRKTYDINIPSIKLVSHFNTKAHYIRRNDFLRAFAPLVGAVVMEKYTKDYCKNNGADEPFNLFHFRRFCGQEEVASIGSTFIQNSPGIYHGFEVPFKTNSLYEVTITSPKEKQALFEFAKGYLLALHIYDPHAQYNREDYIDIQNQVPNLQTAYKALVRITQKLQDKQYQDLSKEEKSWYEASRYVTPKTNGNKPEQQTRSLMQKIQDIFQP